MKSKADEGGEKSEERKEVGLRPYLGYGFKEERGSDRESFLGD